MYVESIYKNLHDFRKLGESAMIEIAIVIENHRSFKLLQDQTQAGSGFHIDCTKLTSNKGHPAHNWVSGGG